MDKFTRLSIRKKQTPRSSERKGVRKEKLQKKTKAKKLRKSISVKRRPTTELAMPNWCENLLLITPSIEGDYTVIESTYTGYYAGAGFVQATSPRSAMYMTFLWDFTYEDGVPSPNPNPFMIRIGYGFKF